MVEAVRVLGLAALATGFLVMACSKPALFPPGGAVAASGYCEVSFSDSPQSAADGYGYEFDGEGTVATLFFEDGALTHFKIFDGPLPPSVDDEIRRRPDVPAWSARGELPVPIVEGRWHDVPLQVLTPGMAADRPEAAGIRFRGEALEVAFGDSVAPADCAWE
jgi:hypothetical protein